MDVAIRCIGMDPLQMVAGARFELYSAYPIRVPAVPASVFATRWDALQRLAFACASRTGDTEATPVEAGDRI